MGLAKTALLRRISVLRQTARQARRAISGQCSGVCVADYGGAGYQPGNFIAPLETEREKLLCRHTMAAADYRAAFADLSRDLYVMPPALELEGVVASAPYLDRRVQSAALNALLCEPSPAPSRELLGSILEKTVGERLAETMRI